MSNSSGSPWLFIRGDLSRRNVPVESQKLNPPAERDPLNGITRLWRGRRFNHHCSRTNVGEIERNTLDLRLPERVRERLPGRQSQVELNHSR